jgi:hypothetical protein
VADIGEWNQKVGLKHVWLKTGTKEAGLGPAGGGIPGDDGQIDIPYVADTIITDHTGRSNKPGVTCTKLPDDIDEDCVNKKLIIGQPQGKWTGFNQCWNFVEKIILECRNRCLF